MAFTVLPVVQYKWMQCTLGVVLMVALCCILNDERIIFSKIKQDSQITFIHCAFEIVQKFCLLPCNVVMADKFLGFLTRTSINSSSGLVLSVVLSLDSHCLYVTISEQSDWTAHLSSRYCCKTDGPGHLSQVCSIQSGIFLNRQTVR